MQTPIRSVKNIFTLPDSRVVGVAFLTPHLFALATINIDLSSAISIGDIRVKKVKSINTCSGQITSLSLCDDLKKIAVGLLNKIEVYDIETGKQVCEYKGHAACVNSVSAHPIREQVLISGGEDKAITLWDLRSHNGSKIENAHMAGVKIVRLAGKENHFLSCSDDKTIKIWDFNQLKPLHTINQYTQFAPLAMEYNKQGDRFMICVNHLNRYNAQNAALMATFNCGGGQESLRGSRIRAAHSMMHSCASANKDEHEIMAIGTEEGKIALCYPEKKDIACTVDAFKSPVDQMAFNKIGEYLIACSQQEELMHVYELPERPARLQRGFKGCLGLE